MIDFQYAKTPAASGGDVPLADVRPDPPSGDGSHLPGRSPSCAPQEPSPFTSVPEEMKRERRWVLWRTETRDGKPTKVPYQTNWTRADSTDPSTWADFETAMGRYLHFREYVGGIGFVLGDGWVGVDIDGCIDESGDVSREAREIVEALGSYTELSPSGRGIHIICRGELPPGNRRKGKIEMYDKGRYFTVTGRQVPGFENLPVEERTEALKSVHARVLGRGEGGFRAPALPASEAQSRLSAPELYKWAKREVSAYFTDREAALRLHNDDDSAADMALANHLAYKALGGRTSFDDGDVKTLETVMRMSALSREKWDRPDYLLRTIERALNDRAARNKEEREKTGPEGWTHKLVRNKSGAPVANDTYNVTLALREAPELRGLFVYDCVKSGWELTRTPPWGVCRKRDDSCADEPVIIDLLHYLQENYGIRAERSRLHECVLAVALETWRNPITEHVRGLPQWDGVERLETWLIRYLGAEDNEYHRFVGREFLLGAVARALQPGCKMDFVLILQGKQGIGKSMTVRTLFSPFYLSGTIDPDNRDSILNMEKAWCVELGELVTLNRKEAEDLKEFITRQEDAFRLPYARNSIKVPRHTVFVGTTNEREYLKDPTGNRRFWPVECKKIDIEALKEDRDQLLAEARAIYERRMRDRGDWYVFPSGEIVEAVSKMQEDREVGHPWTEPIEHYLYEEATGEFPVPGAIPGAVTVEEVLKHALDKNIGMCSMADQRSVGQILRKLGWQKMRYRVRERKRYFWVAPEIEWPSEGAGIEQVREASQEWLRKIKAEREACRLREKGA